MVKTNAVDTLSGMPKKPIRPAANTRGTNNERNVSCVERKKIKIKTEEMSTANKIPFIK